MSYQNADQASWGKGWVHLFHVFLKRTELPSDQSPVSAFCCLAASGNAPAFPGCVKAIVRLENKGSALHEGNLDAGCHTQFRSLPKAVTAFVSVEILLLLVLEKTRTTC